MAKDLFSTQASDYAKYRPHYPPELFDYILGFVEGKDCAWDCATGNGQAAVELAKRFNKVEATDLSDAQLKEATPNDKVHYQVSPAEKTPFGDNSFDLITVGTAYHWLDWKAFYTEATRVGKRGCVVAVWSYHTFFSSDEKVTGFINHFYNNVIKPYWDPERAHVESRYATVEFDFEPLPAKDFDLPLRWKKEGLIGYLTSWSAVQNYIKKRGESPLDLVKADLQKAWPDEDKREFHFPLFMCIGRVTKQRMV